MNETPARDTPGAASKGAAPPFLQPGGPGAPAVPRIALAGEVNSGKTSLVNFLLQAQLLAVDIVPNTVCPTLLRFGETAHARTHHTDGAVTIRPLSDLHRLGRERLAFIEVLLPSPVLRGIEVVDLPGLASPADAKAMSRWLETADVQVWCSPATQAWKASEQATWRALGRPSAGALLVLTHRDLLTPEQLRLVGERMTRETQGFFSGWTAISAPAAIAARNPRGEVVRHEAWSATGVEDFLTRLTGLLRDAAAQRGIQQPVVRRTTAYVPATELPHPLPSFAQLGERIMAEMGETSSPRQAAGIMTRELASYASQILQPWLARKGRLDEAGRAEALIPRAEADILDYLAADGSGSARQQVAKILHQMHAELAETIHP